MYAAEVDWKTRAEDAEARCALALAGAADVQVQLMEAVGWLSDVTAMGRAEVNTEIARRIDVKKQLKKAGA